MNSKLQKNSVGYYFMNLKTYTCDKKYKYLDTVKFWISYTPFLNSYEDTKKIKIKELILILYLTKV